jgi:hypothetical protein
MLADRGASALFALGALPPMLADRGASALFAIGAHPPMLADRGASALFALGALPPMLADRGASALFAMGALPPMRTNWTRVCAHLGLLALLVWRSLRRRWQRHIAPLFLILRI